MLKQTKLYQELKNDKHFEKSDLRSKKIPLGVTLPLRNYSKDKV